MIKRLVQATLWLPLACAADDAPASGDTDAGTATEGTTDSAGTETGGGPAPTFYEDVAPVVMEHCASCHRPGSVAPFSLLTYEDAKPWGAAAAAATAARVMPPIPADASGACNTFSNVRWLSDDEVSIFTDWVVGGLLEGDPANAPEVPPPPGDLVGANVTLDMGAEFTPGLTDDYRCFVVDPGLESMKYLTGYQVNPGERQVVHHVIVYAPASDAASTEAEALDAQSAEMGYPCFGGAEVESAPIVLWAPGLPPTDYPEGTGIAVEPGRKLVMQVHYNTMAGKLPDQTTVDLRFEDSVDKTGLMFLVANTGLQLPPGEPEVVDSYDIDIPAFPGSIELWGVLPHMHELGRELTVTLDDQCVIDVPLWDFNWQRAYFYDEPIAVSGGQTVSISCTFDTTSRTEPVYWGEGTQDEMCLAYTYIAY